MRKELLGLCIIIVINCIPGNCSLPLDSSFVPRIVGGFLANNVSIPYIVSVQKYGNHKCGGVIINKQTILTSAHCIVSERPSALRVHVGSKSTSIREGEIYSVNALHTHESYKSSDPDYDIGLIRLSRPLSYSTAIQPIRLPYYGEELIDGDYGIVSGWGLNNPKDLKGSDQLYFAIVPVVKQSVCDRLIGYATEVGHLTNRMFCAGYLSGGIDACRLDAGGPLTLHGKVVGIVSWGIGCAEPNRPGVYARVSAYTPWIQNILWSKYWEFIQI